MLCTSRDGIPSAVGSESEGRNVPLMRRMLLSDWDYSGRVGLSINNGLVCVVPRHNAGRCSLEMAGDTSATFFTPGMTQLAGRLQLCYTVAGSESVGGPEKLPHGMMSC